MRSLFLTLAIMAAPATPLAAQSDSDSAGIRAAALTSAGREATMEAHIERIVGDTAWVALYDPRTPVNGAAPTDSTAGWIGAQLPWAGMTLERVRVERRAGKWQRANQREGVTTS